MVEEVLKHGQENSLSKAELCTILGIDKDHLRIAIERERREGALILSSVHSGAGGYFLPQTTDELAEYVKTQTHRGKTVFQRLQPMKLALKRARLKEQHNGESIFDFQE